MDETYKTNQILILRQIVDDTKQIISGIEIRSNLKVEGQSNDSMLDGRGSFVRNWYIPGLFY